MLAQAHVQKVLASDGEVAEGGYYTIIEAVASTASVPNFVVGRKCFGSILFKAPVDLTGILSFSMLREIAEIERGCVPVHPDETMRVPQGTGLKLPAEVSIENHRPPPDMELEEYVQQLQSKPDTKFVSYNANHGVWTFNVDGAS